MKNLNNFGITLALTPSNTHYGPVCLRLCGEHGIRHIYRRRKGS